MLAILLFQARAAVLTVGPSGDHATIGAAVAAAADGDEIEVEAGTYAECVDLGGKDLAIQGADGATLDGTGCAAALTVALGEVASVGDLAIANVGGRALAVSGGSVVALSGVDVSGAGSETTLGAALYVDAASVSVDGAAFSSNTALYGAHAYVANGGSLAITGSTLDAGTATYGGAIYVEADGVVDVDSSTFTSNAASEGGGAFYLGEGATLDLLDSQLSANSAYRGGAIYADLGGTVGVAGGGWSSNQATEHGGALYGGGGLTITLDSASLSENQAVYGSGGALYLYGVADLSLADVAVTGQYAWSDGGAFYLEYNVELEVAGGSFTSNTSEFGQGGAIWQYFYGNLRLDGVEVSNNTALLEGGALYLEFLVGEVEITGCTLSGNTSVASDGGAIRAYNYLDLAVDSSTLSDNVAGYSGGAMAVDPAGEVVLARTTFERNTASEGNGGALELDAYTEGTWSVALSELQLTDNAAAYDGGGLSASDLAALTIDASIFSANTADTAGIGRDGGAMAVAETGALTVTRSRYCGNSARNGGAVTTDAVDAGDWRNTAFLENTATGQGGAIYTVDSTHAVTNDDLLGNTAAEGAIYAGTSAIELVNTIVAWSTGGGISGDAESAAASAYRYSDWAGNDTDVGGAFEEPSTSDGNLDARPELATYELGDPCDSDLSLDEGSRLIDAGDPDILDGNGSRSDIGVEGGPLADGQARSPEDTGHTHEPSGDSDDTAGSADDTDTKIAGPDCGCASPGRPLGGIAFLGLYATLLRRRKAYLTRE